MSDAFETAVVFVMNAIGFVIQILCVFVFVVCLVVFFHFIRLVMVLSALLRRIFSFNTSLIRLDS